MMARKYEVFAKWDPEASVWVAWSDDIPGLATEAETFERLVERVLAIAPELLDLNGVEPDGDGEVRITAERHERILHAA